MGNRPVPRFVGRLDETTRLRGELDALPASSRTVTVVGEPGIGKTWLLDQLDELALGRGIPVLRGRATELERGMPFAVLRDAMSSLVEAPEIWLAEDSGVERHLGYRRFAQSLRSFAATGAVLIIDDLHWADQGSVEFVDHLVRHQVPGLLLTLAYRPRQAPTMVEASLHDARATGNVEHVELAPFTKAEAESFAAGRVSPQQLSNVYHQSGGNPLYLAVLLHTAGQDTDEPLLNRPMGVHALLLRDVHALTEADQLFLRTAAVLGDPFDVSVATELVGIGDDAGSTTIDRLVRRDLVRPDSGGTVFRFRHPLVRSAVYQDCGVGWRRMAHRRAVRTLRRRGAGVLEVAHHVAASAARGDTAAVELLDEAAGMVHASAPSSAADWLGMALQILPDHPNTRELRYGLLVRRTIALGISGRLRESRTLFHEILDSTEHAPAAARVGAVRFCAFVEQLLGNYVAATALLERELKALPPGHPAEAAALALGLGTIAMVHADFAGAYRYAHDVLTLAASAGRQDLAAAAGGLLAFAAAVSGDLASADSAAAEATASFDSLTDVEVAGQLDNLANLGWAHIHLQRHPTAHRLVSRGVEVARRTGQNYLLPYLLQCAATADAYTGRLAAAASAAQDCEEIARLMGSEELVAMAQALLSQVLLWSGKGSAEPAVRVAERAMAATSATPGLVGRKAVYMVAQTSLAVDDPERAIAVLVTAGGGEDLPLWASSMRPMALEVLTKAALMLGRHEQAAGWAAATEHAARVMTGPDLPGAQGWALRARAEVLLAGRDADQAAQLALQAAQCFEQIGWTIDEARARLLAGIAHTTVGQLDAADQQLGEAGQLADSCGAVRIRTMVQHQRRRLAGHRRAHRQRPETPTRQDMLTKREQQIAQLIQKGKTSRQIASELKISFRTVDSHVDNILRKLGVPSRAAIPDALTRRSGR
jgi:ATP/maltotriose-dependent transcriptional regulator MalT